MKKFTHLLSSLSIGILSLVIVSIANSSGCFCFYQPKAPQALENFKKIK